MLPAEGGVIMEFNHNLLMDATRHRGNGPGPCVHAPQMWDTATRGFLVDETWCAVLRARTSDGGRAFFGFPGHLAGPRCLKRVHRTWRKVLQGQVGRMLAARAVKRCLCMAR